MKKYILALISFIVLVFVFEIFTKDGTPDFFMEKINAIKGNRIIMKEIGGYQEFEFKYNVNELKEDTLNFEIIIYGRDKNVVNKGYALKNVNGEWGGINDTTYVQDN